MRTSTFHPLPAHLLSRRFIDTTTDDIATFSERYVTLKRVCRSIAQTQSAMSAEDLLKRRYCDAMFIAQRIMNSLSEPASLERIQPAARNGPNTLLSNAGVAILAAAIEDLQPECAASFTTSHLQYAASSYYRMGGGGLFTGWAGMYCAAVYASHRSGRYPTLRARLRELLNTIEFAEAEPVTNFRAYDLISGRAGAYVAMHYEDPSAFESQLERIERWFERIFSAEEVRWQTPWTSAQNTLVNNLGVSHGIAGVLAALCTSTSPRVDNLIDAIALWIAEKARVTGDSVEWPCAVAGDRDFGVRYGWCYGTPGIAVVLLRAAVRRNNAEWRDMAVAALHWMMRGDRDAWNVRDYGLCHGWSGIALCFLAAGRLAGDTRLAHFAAQLCHEIIDAHDESTLLGYEAARPDGSRYASVSLLEGAPGVALLLLSVTANVNAGWMRIFGLM